MKKIRETLKEEKRQRDLKREAAEKEEEETQEWIAKVEARVAARKQAEAEQEEAERIRQQADLHRIAEETARMREDARVFQRLRAQGHLAHLFRDDELRDRLNQHKPGLM